MPQDRYGLPLTTSSAPAAEAYNEGVDRAQAMAPFAEEKLREAVQADPNFALARSALARLLQVRGEAKAAGETFTQALALAGRVSEREAGHLDALACLFDGRTREAPARILAHLKRYPLDAQLLAPMVGVFGLIAFSGRAGAKAEVLALVERYADYYGDDWWYQTALAFALCELGRLERAAELTDASLAACPENAQGAHIKAHIAYERGDPDAGYDYLCGFLRDYHRDGLLYTHLSWHLALLALARGERKPAWRLYEEALSRPCKSAPPINVLTDCCSFLLRAQLAGEEISRDRWADISDYGCRHFPKQGLSFADLHCAIAHVMAGDEARRRACLKSPRGPVGDLMGATVRAFTAFAREDWPATLAELAPLMSQHERFGGSNAQRDLLELTFATALVRSGAEAEAKRFIGTRRPVALAPLVRWG